MLHTMNVQVKCRGITPLLMNRMTEDELEGLRTKRKKPKSKDVGTTVSTKEQAAPKVHVDNEGRAIIPVENIMACLIGAGQHVRLEGRKQVSSAKSTSLPSFMWLTSTTIHVIDPETEKEAEWVPDVRRGVNAMVGAVCICRPKFDRWSFTCTIEIDEEEVGENLVRELWDKAGRRIGLGDFRPSRRGMFGQFVVECWKKM